MPLPKIELGDIPAFAGEVGLYGSSAGEPGMLDDRLLVIMVYVFDTNVAAD